jgi:hypothetical protein
MTDRTDTRRQLIEMRSRLISNLEERIEGGALSLLSAVNGALSAIDAETLTGDVEPMQRAVVTEAPGLPIHLTLYPEEGRAAVIDLSPMRAIIVANNLIEAAIRRISDASAQ